MTTGASRRERYQRIADRIRSIPDERFGIRPHSVDLIIATSTNGTYTGDGQRVETVIPVTHSSGALPKVRWAKDQDVAMGLVPAGSVTIGPITSDFAGFENLANLDGQVLVQGEVRLLRITGPNHPTGADYRVTGVTADRALHYMITASPVGSQG